MNYLSCSRPHLRQNIRDLKQNSRGRQTNKTSNYRRQKAHMNTWNKADICPVLISNDTSLKFSWTAPFPHCLETVADISRTNVHRFAQEETLDSTEFHQKTETYRVTKSKDMLNKNTTEDYEEIVFFPLEVSVAVMHVDSTSCTSKSKRLTTRTRWTLP